MKISVIGSNPLYQWEKDRRISLEGADLTHRALFARPDGGAYVVDTFMEDGTVYAKIPNIWLQMSGIMRVYVVDGNEHVVHRASLFVTPREKPDSYVYTETEILSFVSLDERLRRLEGDPSVGGYATEQWVREGFQPKGNYLESSALPAAIDTALAQAKESGAFDGAPGEPGKNGQDYVLTPEDLTEIANQAAELVQIPEGDGKAFIVTITESGDKYTADKIPSEIYAAHNSGVPVLASLMAEDGIVIAYLITVQYDVAAFQVPNFMLGEEHMGVTVIIAGNDPADRSVSVVETAGNADYELPIGGAELGGVKNGGNVVINEDGTMTAPESSGGGIAVTGATPGQTVKISAVDENGVPTAWEPVDFPSGEGEWVEICSGNIAEAVSTISIRPDDTDAKELLVYGNLTASADTKIRLEIMGKWTVGKYTESSSTIGNWSSPFVYRQYINKEKRTVYDELSGIVTSSRVNTDQYAYGNLPGVDFDIVTSGVTFTTGTSIFAYYKR